MGTIGSACREEISEFLALHVRRMTGTGTSVVLRSFDHPSMIVADLVYGPPLPIPMLSDYTPSEAVFQTLLDYHAALTQFELSDKKSRASRMGPGRASTGWKHHPNSGTLSGSFAGKRQRVV
jgi:hypothetical protein